MKKQLKKLLLLLTMVLGIVTVSNSQEIGVRFGDVSAGNVAIDAVFSTGDFNRLHGDISFGDVVAADLIWDFFYRPIVDETLNWYMGVGPYLGILDKDKITTVDGVSTHKNETDFNLGGVFEIGLEYRFEAVPIVVGMDYRPSLEIIDKTDLHFGGFGFNIRYVLD